MELVSVPSPSQNRTAPPAGLSQLGAVKLTPQHRGLLAAAFADADPNDVFDTRLQNEAHDVLALSQLTERGQLRVDWMELTQEALRMLLFMRVVVPRHPDEQNRLRTASHAVLGLIYPREAIRQALPGMAFFELLQPFDVFHPNVGTLGPMPIPRLCLGPELMAGIRCVDLILMAYGALTMQTVQVDERDAAGVLNLSAARWWQQNPEQYPLTRTPFLGETQPAK